jgi:tetrapyrrole methylase family protein/MazG family protein
MRAQKIGKRAAKAGMDFADVRSAANHAVKEMEEFFQAFDKGNATETEKELGDVLFAVVNVGRKAGCDCEKALKESVDRFAARFTKAEALAQADGRVVTELSDVEWDKYYVKAKALLKN